MKLGTLFAGGGGYDIGAEMAGATPAWAVEYDADIADVYRRNLGDHVTVADITTLDPAQFAYVDLLHASPPCPNFSSAKAGAAETEQDRALAESVAGFIEEIKPEFFTLENVRAYEKSQSWQYIYNTLLQLGYGVRWWILNSADYGVPQTRKRMIAIARRDGVLPQKPLPTHEETPSGMFALPRWVSWHEAIEDIIHTLPDSQFAPWQLERLPEEYKTMIMPNRNASTARQIFDAPFVTITATDYKGMATAFYVQGANSQSNGKITNDADEPARTVDTSAKPKAFVVNGTPNDTGQSVTVRNGDESIFTQTASQHKRPTRAAANGRIVAMTLRANARFQSFPDSYWLPDSNTLASRVIGNAVPPLLAAAIVRSLQEVYYD